MWKAQFDAEFAKLKKAEREKDTGKLTGREMFMRDKTLYDSDLRFLEDSEGKCACVDKNCCKSHKINNFFYFFRWRY